MERNGALELNPTSLPLGTRVGPWLVTGWRGWDTSGTVYRAVKVGHEEAGPVALKLAHVPEDKRFEREVERLPRTRHPHVPRLLEHGHWLHPSGAAYPYVVMEWLEAEASSHAPEPAEHDDSPAHALSFVLGFLVVTGGMLMASWLERAVSERFEEASAVAQAPDAGGRDAGSVAVGETALTAPVSSLHTPSDSELIGLDMPRKPFPGQTRPDADGRCPRKVQVAINGGCWVKMDVDLDDCEEDGYVYQGGCYAPAFPPIRQPTSEPSEHIDD